MPTTDRIVDDSQATLEDELQWLEQDKQELSPAQPAEAADARPVRLGGGEDMQVARVDHRHAAILRRNGCRGHRRARHGVRGQAQRADGNFGVDLSARHGGLQLARIEKQQ